MEGSSQEEWEERIKGVREELTAQVEEIVDTRLRELEGRLGDLGVVGKKLEEMESELGVFRDRIEGYQERLDKMDESIVELLSLYEVVSSNVNPFVDGGGGDGEVREKLEELNKRLEEELSRVKEAFESKLEERVSKLEGEFKGLLEQPGDRRGFEGGRRGGARLSHLDSRPETSMLVLKWLEFLLERVGKNNLAEVLEYYVDIGWISDEVSIRMLSYAEGIDYDVEKPGWKLLPADHARSLYFIERILGGRIDRGFLAKVEMELERLEKELKVSPGAGESGEHEH